ncbi:MAG: hypothetical protein ABIR91_04515 [Candidatus Saccharimonadales bacterium]
MSRLRESAHGIARRANETRNTWEVHGWIARAFRWWDSEVGHKRGKSGICYYFYVPLMMPFLWVWLQIKRLFGYIAVQIASAVIVVALFIWLGVTYSTAANVLLVICSVVYIMLSVMAGVMAGLIVAEWEADTDEEDVPVPWWMWLWFVVCAPTSVLGAAIGLIARMIGAQRGRRFARWFVHARLIRGHISPRLATVVVTYVGLVIGAIAAGMPMQIALWLIAIPVVLTIIVQLGRIGVIRLGEQLEYKRKERRREEAERANATATRRLDQLLYALYGMLYDSESSDVRPVYIEFRDKLIRDTNQRIDDDVRYCDDLVDAYRMMAFTVRDVLSLVNHEKLFDQAKKMRDAERIQAERQQLQFSQLSVRRQRSVIWLTPLRVAMTGIVDAIIWLAQILRALKLKVCPIVVYADESPHKSTHS